MERPLIPRLVDVTPSGPLDLQMRLRPVRGVDLKVENGALIEIESAVQTTTIEEDEDRQRCGRLVSLLDGNVSIVEAAARSDVGLESTGEILRTLYELGALEDFANRPVAATSFYHHVVAKGRLWIHLATRGILDPEKLNGPLLFGSLVEEYHYVNSAASIISSAITQSPTPRIRLLLSEFLAEEYWHGLSLREGIMRAGISREDIENAEPLPTTSAVINLLRVLAQTAFLGYAACCGVSETPAGSDGVAELNAAKWNKLRELNLLPDEVLAPFREHEMCDAAAEHSSMFIEPFIEYGTLQPLECRQVEDAVRMLCRAWSEAHHGTVRFYGSQARLVPFSRDQAFYPC